MKLRNLQKLNLAKKIKLKIALVNFQGAEKGRDKEKTKQRRETGRIDT